MAGQGPPHETRFVEVAMKNKTLPVALIQERNHGDAAANLAVIEDRVAEAARRGAKLVLLQERLQKPCLRMTKHTRTLSMV